MTNAKWNTEQWAWVDANGRPLTADECEGLGLDPTGRFKPDVCQHCAQPVRWGRTEQGFAGFVHVHNGKAACR